jgi:3-dehydroquinate synthase
MLIKIKRQHLHTEVLMQDDALDGVDWDTQLRTRTNHFLIADAHVLALHGDTLRRSLASVLPRLHVIAVEQGEAAKSLDVYARATKEISARKADRHTTLISFGGASTANLTGFIAATLLRGIRLIHIPTTLLAQLDGTIDFKQAINLDGVKNLIGAFYSPDLIVVDPRFLTTLSEQHLVNGLAEGLKHALVQDEDLYRLFLNHADDRSLAFLQESIQRTVALKVLLLESESYDEAEMLLQYGHAIGHALESVTRNRLLHGEAISIGMCVSAEVALARGVCGSDTVEAHYGLFDAYGLPTHIPIDCSIEEILRLVYRDKYRSDGIQQMALVSGVGKPAAIDGSLGISIDEQALRDGCIRNVNRVRNIRVASCG